MLGILRDGNGKAIQILNNLSVDLDHLRKSRNSKSTTSVETNLERKNLHLTRQAERVENHLSKSIPKFLCQYSTFITLHFKKRERSNNKLLNKLKIDYDVAKEQYINMTPEEILGEFTKAADSK
jgi:ATP-dependent Clp protease ATP-binding subunit ClpC